MKSSAQLFRASNLSGLMALLCMTSSIGAIIAAFFLLPNMPLMAWSALTGGLLGLLLTICLIFEAVHHARNGYGAARDEWEANHKP